MMKLLLLAAGLSAFLLSAIFMSGCAVGPETVSTEHKGKVTIVHHKRTSGGLTVDRIEAIDPKGRVSEATVTLRTASSPSTSPVHDQVAVTKLSRLKESLASAKVAKEKVNVEREKAVAEVKAAQAKVQDTNNLGNQLDDQISQTHEIEMRVEASMAVQSQANKPAGPTEAEKAAKAEAAVQ